MNYFLLTWNTIGAIILTFQGPFYATTNGVSLTNIDMTTILGKCISQINNLGIFSLLHSNAQYPEVNRSNMILVVCFHLVSNMKRYYGMNKHTKTIFIFQYFAIWAMVGCSLVASKIQYGSVTERLKNSSALGGLFISSLVLLIAIVFLSFYDWRMIYGLTVSCVTIVVTSIFIYLDQKGDSAKEIKKPALGIFAVLWFIVVILRKFIS